MKIAIIDDQPIFQNKILEVTEKIFSIKDIDVFSSIQEYENAGKYYDVMLLDVELEEINSIKYMQDHPQKFTYIIYVTNYAEYMLDAFGLNVIGYVCKDQIEELLPKRLKAAEKLIQSQKIYEFKFEGQIVRVPERNILYFEFEMGFVYMVLENKKKIALGYRTLLEVYKMLSERFWKVNRNCIVNGDKIIRVNGVTHEISFSNGHVVQVSRREWSNFKRAYNLSR